MGLPCPAVPRMTQATGVFVGTDGLALPAPCPRPPVVGGTACSPPTTAWPNPGKARLGRIPAQPRSMHTGARPVTPRGGAAGRHGVFTPNNRLAKPGQGTPCPYGLCRPPRVTMDWAGAPRPTHHGPRTVTGRKIQLSVADWPTTANSVAWSSSVTNRLASVSSRQPPQGWVSTQVASSSS